MDAVERLQSGFKQFKIEVYDKKPELFEPLKEGLVCSKQPGSIAPVQCRRGKQAPAGTRLVCWLPPATPSRSR
ncbi:unnamed protein product [Urochloa humidicola]